MLVLLMILIGLCAFGVIEYAGHQRRLKAIPIRIHVNGSRGKSSVTRLIAAGLRAGGIRTVGKTTGTLPRISDVDGREIAIKRNQPANIIEQTKILRYIQQFKPQALVIECMAVLPEYQWICEHQIVRSTIGVITNTRLDHINEMGHFREQVARSLSNTIPKKGICFTSEKTNFWVLEEVGGKLGTNVHRIGGACITREELSHFDYIEHPANIGLALAVCERVGVDRKTALQGMYHVHPDAGALRVATCIEDKKEVLFVNAMAANDPESSLVIVKDIKEKFAPLGTEMLLVNSRSDRQDRSMQLLEMISGHLEYDYLLLTGQSLNRFVGYAIKQRIPKSKIIGLGMASPEEVYKKVFELAKDKGTIVGLGNVGAGGLDIARYFFKNRRRES